ncbi:TPA: hypothetical protein ACOA1X_003566 [Vibrio cholerae]
MALTQSTNLVNGKIFAEGVRAKLVNRLVLDPLVQMDNLPAGAKGKSITLPKYAYIGDAIKMIEGTPLVPSLLSQTSADVAIEQYGKAVELTDRAVNSGIGDPIGEAEDQVVLAINSKMQADKFAALDAATATETVAAIDNAGVAKVVAKFGEDQEGTTYLIVNPADWATAVGADINFAAKLKEVYDVEFVPSARVAAGAFYAVKDGALGVFLQEGVDTETDRDILMKSTVISADTFAAIYLRDESKAVKVTITPTP